MPGLPGHGRPFNLKFSWLQEWAGLRPAVLDAGKDLQDIDGQGFFPFEKWGEFRADYPGPGRGSKGCFFLAGEKIADRALPGPVAPCFTRAAEQTGSKQRHLFRRPAVSGRIRGSGAANTATSGAWARPGPCCKWIECERSPFNARMFLQYQGLELPDGAQQLSVSCRPEAKPASPCGSGKKTGLSLSYGNLPYEMRSRVADFLEDQRPGADNLFLVRRQPRRPFSGQEKRAPFSGRAAAPAISLAQDLKPSRRERLLLLADHPPFGQLQPERQGALQKDPPAVMGHILPKNTAITRKLTGKSYYFLDRPVTRLRTGQCLLCQGSVLCPVPHPIAGAEARALVFFILLPGPHGHGLYRFRQRAEANDIGVDLREPGLSRTPGSTVSAASTATGLLSARYFSAITCRRACS